MHIDEYSLPLYAQSQPYLMLRKPPEDGSELRGNDRYEGYCADLARKICTDYLNADYTIKLVPDNKYGEKMADGNWNGMIGELTRRVSRVPSSLYAILNTRLLNDFVDYENTSNALNVVWELGCYPRLAVHDA